jgi:hypothetical protein
LKPLRPGILKERRPDTSIETTMNFYVKIAAEETLAEVCGYLRRAK